MLTLVHKAKPAFSEVSFKYQKNSMLYFFRLLCVVGKALVG